MKTGIVGYGKMGKSIVNLLRTTDIDIVVLLRDQEKVDQNNVKIEKWLRRLLRKGMINNHQFLQRLSTFRFTKNFAALRECDLVIESISEDFKKKIAILMRLETVIPMDSVLVTNTSSLTVNGLAHYLSHGERFCGFHFFYPVSLSSVVEIIKWEKVADTTIDFLCEVCRFVNMTPLIVNDAPGSVLNTILGSYYCESLYLLEQGLAIPSEIDRIAGKFYRMGPCESLDVIGLSFFLNAFERHPRRYGVDIPTLLHRMVIDGRMGKDCGKGLFIYQGDQGLDDTRNYYIEPNQKHSCRKSSASEAEIEKRLLYSILATSLHCVARGIATADEIDLGVREVLGMREGPFTVMRSLGREYVKKEFEKLKATVGYRFDPSLTDVL